MRFLHNPLVIFYHDDADDDCDDDDDCCCGEKGWVAICDDVILRSSDLWVA